MLVFAESGFLNSLRQFKHNFSENYFFDPKLDLEKANWLDQTEHFSQDQKSPEVGSLQQP